MDSRILSGSVVADVPDPIRKPKKVSIAAPAAPMESTAEVRNRRTSTSGTTTAVSKSTTPTVGKTHLPDLIQAPRDMITSSAGIRRLCSQPYWYVGAASGYKAS